MAFVRLNKRHVMLCYMLCIRRLWYFIVRQEVIRTVLGLAASLSTSLTDL